MPKRKKSIGRSILILSGLLIGFSAGGLLSLFFNNKPIIVLGYGLIGAFIALGILLTRKNGY